MRVVPGWAPAVRGMMAGMTPPEPTPMLRRGLLAALVACGAGLGGCAHWLEDEAGTKARLVAQANAWDKAIVRQDRAAIEANMHEGFFQIDRRGSRYTRAEFLDDITDPKLKLDPYTVEQLEVHLHGSLALLTATTRISGHYDGRPFRTHYRYIDVYRRELGVWKIVSVQITGLADAAN